MKRSDRNGSASPCIATGTAWNSFAAMSLCSKGTNYAEQTFNSFGELRISFGLVSPAYFRRGMTRMELPSSKRILNQTCFFCFLPIILRLLCQQLWRRLFDGLHSACGPLWCVKADINSEAARSNDSVESAQTDGYLVGEHVEVENICTRADRNVQAYRYINMDRMVREGSLVRLIEQEIQRGRGSQRGELILAPGFVK